MAGAPDLAAVEARLASILDPYRDRLETATIYGIPTLRRPGARAHDWFAFVKPASRHVGFFLLPVHAWPDLAGSTSPALRKRLTGKSTFTFTAIDEELFEELEALVARAFAAYMAAGQGAGRRR
jgi:hypothetical protein